SLRPHDQRRHGGEDRLDIAAGFESEDGAAVVEQVELDVAAAADELLLAVRLSPRRQHVAADDLRIDADKSAANALREGEVGVPVSAVEIVVEDAADAAHLFAVGQVEIFVAPLLEALIVG